MTFNATPTGGNWENKLIDQIKLVEGFSKRVYGDSLGVPTLGYGFALVVKGSGPDPWALRVGLVDELLAIGITLSGNDLMSLNCYVPDESIVPRSYALFVAREILTKLSRGLHS